MIIFIAMILVAGIAASIMLQTMDDLQSQALKTGKESINDVSSGVEITHISGIAVAPDGVKVANPAFDVTPHKYVSAIITENGIAREPYLVTLRDMVKGK